MTHIVNPTIENYLADLRPARDDILIEMEELARKKEFPAVGPDVGMLLNILTRALNARSVLELGSGYGYSALWIARALGSDGRITCTDMDPGNAELARSFFARAGLQSRLTFMVGDALDLIDHLEGPYDIVFNDLDKEHYPAVIDKVAPRLRQGGLFITDNALWHGSVTEPDGADEQTSAVVAFNRRLKTDARFHTVILPLRDGVSLSVRT
jgi:predicted O-methyltransferase YrrM